MGADQRKNFRIPVPDDQRSAVIRRHAREIAVYLENESAGGFAVTIPQAMVLTAGEEFDLRCDGDWRRVRVMHQQIVGATTHVGLERLDESADTGGLAALLARFTGGLGGQMWQRLPASAKTGVAAAAGLAVLAALCCWVFQPSASATTHYGRQAAALAEVTLDPALSQLAIGEPLAQRAVVREVRRLLDGWKPIQKRLGKHAAGFEESYARFVRQRVLISDPARDALDLSASQVEEIRKVLARGETRLAWLEPGSSGDVAHLRQHAAETLQRSERDALALLTDEQRLAWSLLTRDSQVQSLAANP